MHTDTTPESRYSWRHVGRRFRGRRSRTSGDKLAQLDKDHHRDPWPFPRSPEQAGIDCLLELSARSMRDSDRWCDLRSAQSIVMRSGIEVQLSIAAAAMPSELASIDEHGVVRPRVRGLVRGRVGRSLVSNFPGAIEVACSRARAGRRTVSKRHLRRQLDLGRTATRRLAAVLDAEGNCFVTRRWRWMRPWRVGGRWRIEDTIDLYDNVETVARYLAIQALHPVVAHGRRIASRKHDADSPSRLQTLIGWLGANYLIPVAVLLTAAIITAWATHTNHDAKGSPLYGAARAVVVEACVANS